MSWTQLHSHLPRHRKIRALVKLLGISPVDAIGHVVMIWCEAMDTAPSGDISSWGSPGIAAAAEWDGDPDKFVQALFTAGFVDRVADRLLLHNWCKYNRLEARRRGNKREPMETNSNQREPMVTNGSQSVPREDKRREEERREEKKREELTPLSPQGGSGNQRGPMVTNGSQSAPSSEVEQKIQQIWDHWQSTHSHLSGTKMVKLNAMRRSKIAARLKDGFSAEDLCRAITANAQDQWHSEHKKHEIEYVLRNDAQVVKFMALAPAARKSRDWVEQAPHIECERDERGYLFEVRRGGATNG